MEKAVEEGRGKESDAEFAGNLMGWMCERCGDITIGNEWICADPYVQKDHAADPFDAFTKPVTNQSMLYFTQMMNARRRFRRGFRFTISGETRIL